MSDDDLKEVAERTRDLAFDACMARIRSTHAQIHEQDFTPEQISELLGALSATAGCTATQSIGAEAVADAHGLAGRMAEVRVAGLRGEIVPVMVVDAPLKAEHDG